MDHSTASRPASRAASALAALVLVVAGLTVAAGTTVSASAATTSSVRLSGHQYESRVRHWINVKRTKHGLRELRNIRCANRTATRWTRHLIRTDSFYHQKMSNVLDRCNATYAAETLGKGGVTPRRLVGMWMDSPGHRAILLSKQPRRIGIGSSVDGDGQWVTTANFVKR